VNGFITVSAATLAAIGLAGLLLSAGMTNGDRRRQALRVGTRAMGLSGLTLMLGGLVGWADTNALFGGLIMVVFASGVSLPPTSAATTAVDPRRDGDVAG